ncbi:tetratricopeptide repeat protein [sulfur-oxidizing endosymbiont of Gigantopelta aegis]|uniref:tetratricopeptide repeat protein n=1 Tax=sulfur-oxidizing endosymbiont of Gigantopelta aegis TaxID=2794934 RepID=UPI0018DC4050|nr:tetratricopeptide repeat protein [sulfur-oxidizing endosymbiont of Gigantopelta aegis]
MDMVQIFLDIGELEQASNLFARLPKASHETEMGKALMANLHLPHLPPNSTVLRRYKTSSVLTSVILMPNLI